MQRKKVNMDNYQFYLPARVQCFKSSEYDLIEEVLYFLGASIGLGDGDLDGCTSYDGDFDDVTFSFHICLACGLDLGGVGSSFTTSLGSSSSFHSFFGG